MHTYLHIDTYIHIYIFTYLYLYIISICTCMYICVHAHVYILEHMRTNSIHKRIMNRNSWHYQYSRAPVLGAQH